MLSARLTAAAAIFAAAMALQAAPAAAQIGKAGGPVDIESDQLQVIDAERKAVFLSLIHIWFRGWARRSGGWPERSGGFDCA